MNADIRVLAEEVASKKLSSITLYQTGRILYSCHNDVVPTNNNINVGHSDDLINSFDDMMSSLPRILLHNLHLAYASLILSYSKSASTMLCPAISAINAIIKKPLIKSSVSWKDIMEGTESLCGIYISSVNACQCCRGELDLVFASLSWVYDSISKEKGGDSNIMQTLILKTLSRLLVHGLLYNGKGEEEEESDVQLSNIMTVIQNIQSYNCALGDMLNLNDYLGGEQSFVNATLSKFEQKDASQTPQLQYLMAMLESSSKSSIKKLPSITNDPTSKTEPAVIDLKPSKQTMTDIQIDHIKSVLPTLGEGYIEEALKCYNHDVERTLEALLEASEGGGHNIHPRLLTLPSNLPRKMKENVEQYSANVDLHRGATRKEDGKEHVKVQKQHIKHVEQQAEAEAFLIENVSRSLGGIHVDEEDADDNDEFGIGMHDEYDDDYDDQYDGIGDDGGATGGIGGMDEGLYDVDIHNVHQRIDRGGAKNEQQMWRQYNTLIKDVESEGKFWEDSRNLNRKGGYPGKSQGNGGGDEQGDEGKQYRGPDKGKGGRLIGPDGKYLPIKRGGSNNAGRGGGKAKGRESGSGGGNQNKKDGDTDMSKVQKRRKNDNKANIGNHRRKDRATKKASGGMV